MQAEKLDASGGAGELKGLSGRSLIDFAHDLRNPLGSMQNALDVISLDSGISDQSSNMLAILTRQLQRLSQIVSEFSNQAGDNQSENSSDNASLELTLPCLVTVTTQDILVVDDTRASAYALKTLLKSLGQNVRSAENATEAMAAVNERMPNLIFSDIVMADVDGFEVAKMVRSLPLGHSVRLIAVTGSSDFDSKYKAIESGFDDYIVKPISYAVLVELLNRVNG